MNDVKWVKITTDMFDNRKIKQLRTLPDGNNIVLIWVMLLTMAGRCNSGGMIFLTENIPYTPKMLATELGFEENTVALALESLEHFNMIHTDGFLSIVGWEEYQNVGKLSEIREYNRIAKQKQRERQKQALLGDVKDKSMTSQPCQDTDIDIDKDIDIDIEKESKEKKKTGKRFSPPTVDEVRAYCQERNNGIDAQRFVDFYTSKGWKVGNTPMKDWKACIRTWEKRAKEKGGIQHDAKLDGIL